MSQQRAYAERTYASPHWIVRFPHRKRFDFVATTLDELRPRTMLDYGAGDGHLLANVLAGKGSDLQAVAYEPVLGFREQLKTTVREAGVERSVRVLQEIDDFAEPIDLIICMGVLEHLTISERMRFYETAERCLAPDGHVLIDVPIEHGVTLLIKNFGRRVLKGDPSEYRWPETLAATLGRTTVDPERWDAGASASFISSHKGFDHRLLTQEAAGRFHLERRVATPFGRLPALAGNQEMFLLLSRLRPRAT